MNVIVASGQGVLLSHNISAGVILSNVSLVLRAVTNARAGLYTCTAINSRGESTSEPLSLRIQCKYSIPIIEYLIFKCDTSSYQY